MMTSFIKGQLPAQQTKVVDHGLGPLKAGPTCLCSRFVTMMLHPQIPLLGKDVVDIHK